MNLKSIKLELARTREHPDGDPRHAYLIRAPLTAEGQIDSKAFSKMRDLCSVTKSSPDTGNETGCLIRTRKGFAISYAPGDDDDEAIYHLASHIFRLGEYVTITEHDDIPRTFKVVSVKDAVIA